MGKEELLSPTNDLVFKAIFGRNQSKILLTSLLNSILKLEGENKIKTITYQNPFNLQEFKTDKLSILDIKVKTGNNEIINIEVQVEGGENFIKRSLYYWSKIYSQTLKESEEYIKLKKTIVISILNFKLFRKTEKYHNKYVIKEEETNEVLTNDLEIHYIELPKLNKSEIENMTEKEAWLTFLKYGENSQILYEIKKRSGKIKMAAEMLERVSADTIMREKYEALEKARLDEKSRLGEATRKGIEKGIQEGIYESAEKMLASGMSIKEVVKILGITEKEMIEYRKHTNKNN